VLKRLEATLIKEIYFPAYSSSKISLRSCLTSHDIAILDKYGEANLLMWILFRLFQPSTKIVPVFHHYEPHSVKHNKARLSQKFTEN